MLHSIEHHASGKKVLLLFLLTNAVYAIMIFGTIPYTMEYANGMRLLDMMPTGYGPDHVNQLFSSLGVEGRETYLGIQIPVDMVYPFLFATTYSLLMAYFLKKRNLARSPYAYLCFLPIIAGIADYLENIGIITLIKTYPDLDPAMIRMTSTFSVLKASFVTIFFVALLLTLLTFGIRFLRRER